MKKVLLLVAVGFGIISCGDSNDNVSKEEVKEVKVIEMVPEEGVVVVKNGLGEDVEVPFNCVYGEGEIELNIIEDLMISYASELESTLKSPRSYIPESFEIDIYSKDSAIDVTSGEIVEDLFSVFIRHSYYGDNSYGTSILGSDLTHILLQNGINVSFMKGDIKKDDVEFIKEDKEGRVNRSIYFDNGNTKLVLSNVNGTHYLIVDDVDGCTEDPYMKVNYGEDNEFRINSPFNSFSCDGMVFFKLTNSQWKKLISMDVERIMVSTGRSTIHWISVFNNNEKDYFKQCFDLINE